MKKRNHKKIRLFLLLFCMINFCCPKNIAADPAHSKTASSKTIDASTVETYGMVPVYGRDLEDGIYPIDIKSSSSFFKIIDARLFVENGEMHAELVLSSGSYLLLYMGTGSEAAAAEYEDYIEITEENGMHKAAVPVEALNKGIDCAAFSKRRKKWYDRKILFEAASLPENAICITLPDYDLIEDAVKAYQPDALEKTDVTDTKSRPADSALMSKEAVSIELPDGEYSIEVDMTGGSGRANVSSPALLIAKGGRAYAKLLWSSPNYDYMIAGGITYQNETTDGGNSTFVIPITAMDHPIPIIADTTAMGDPVAIEYSLTFYRETIGEKKLIPQEAAKSVLITALFIIIAGFLLNCYLKKRHRE